MRLEMFPRIEDGIKINNNYPGGKIPVTLVHTKLKIMNLNINGRKVVVDVEPSMPLLWVLRDELNMTGTKFGCGVSSCGACTVHLDGVATRTCTLSISEAEGRQITTIEGVGEDGHLSAVQLAWIEHQVPQCGYCQSGMIMAAEALLKDIPEPSDEDINEKITNICRCGTYNRIRAAIHTAAKMKLERNSLLGHLTTNPEKHG